MLKNIYFLIITLLLCSCSRQNDIFDEDLSYRFDRGMESFLSGKYSNSEQDFIAIIQNNPGSSLALEAQYYLAEAVFLQDRYEEAEVEFDRFIRFSNDPQRIERARYKSCKCAFESTNDYLFDQSYTAELLDKLQFFIEEYPMSEFEEEVIILMQSVRKRLARKDYEAARLYMKLREFQSARIYFHNILENYYDTDYADEARISIIFSFLLEGDNDSAETIFRQNKNKFKSEENKFIAKNLIAEMIDGEMSLEHYIRLYK